MEFLNTLRDANVNLQPHGGFYVQATIQGQNRYIGIFQRSLVGVYAIIAARRYPYHLCDSGVIRRWVENMVNYEQETRVQQPSAKRPRTHDLE